MAGPVLVLCLGNDLRHDDGAGWAVGADLAADPLPDAVIRCSALTGFHLLDELEGHEHVIVVDAIATGRHPPGTVVEFPLGALEAGPATSPHGIGLSTVLEVGGRAGLSLPLRIDVVAIEGSRPGRARGRGRTGPSLGGRDGDAGGRRQPKRPGGRRRRVDLPELREGARRRGMFRPDRAQRAGGPAVAVAAAGGRRHR